MAKSGHRKTGTKDEKPCGSGPAQEQAPDAFAIKDCALAALATGVRAYNLRDLRDELATVHPGSIYYHFWGGLLRPRFDLREYNNDFAVWCLDAHGLHDEVLAERLSVVDPTEYADLESLRQEVVDLIDERLEESERLSLIHADEPFQFIRSQIVIFNTNRAIKSPRELTGVLPHLSTGSVFYHFIDARRRSVEGKDDFRMWLAGFGDEYAGLCEKLAEVDPYFVSLAVLREQLTHIFREYFEGGGR